MDAFNELCSITKVKGADARSQPILGETREELCSVVKLFGADVGVAMGIGSAPDYPTSQERVADLVLLLPMTTRTSIGDMIEIANIRFKVIGISPSYDGVGKLARYVVEATLWA